MKRAIVILYDGERALSETGEQKLIEALTELVSINSNTISLSQLDTDDIASAIVGRLKVNAENNNKVTRAIDFIFSRYSDNYGFLPDTDKVIANIAIDLLVRHPDKENPKDRVVITSLKECIICLSQNEVHISDDMLKRGFTNQLLNELRSIHKKISKSVI